MRRDGYQDLNMPEPISKWPGMMGNVRNRQYERIDPSSEYPMGSFKGSSRSAISQFETYPEQDTTYSSSTSMLHGNNSNTIRPGRHGKLESTWRPGFWQRFPWLGILSLLTAVLATLACVVVLTKSNGVPINSWQGPFQPTVYVSICTALANIALTYALYEGVVISFWRKACQGATLTELHQYWHSGSSLWAALYDVSLLRGKITAFACIMTVLSILRGPIMQRASSVTNRTLQLDGNLTIYSAIELPFGYAGQNTGRTSSPSFMNPNFTDIVQAYTNRDKIAGLWRGCDATCYSQIEGIGFDVSCNISHPPYFLDPIPNGDGGYSIRNATQVFSVNAGQFYEDSVSGSDSDYDASLLLNATFMGPNPTDALNGTLVEHTCALRAGIVRYSITISNNSINLQSSDWRNDTFLEPHDFERLPYNSISNLAGFILAAKSLYYGTADFQFGGGVGWILNLDGASANRYFQRPNASLNEFALDQNISWRDPMDDMINSMREIAFRTSLQIALDNTSYANATQVVPYSGTTIKTVYTADYRIMLAAVALSLAGVIAVIPTFYGFWELGRPVTLSPLEVAKAFGAPLLTSLPGNRPAKDMLLGVHNVKVRYGDSGTLSDLQTSGASQGGGEVRKLEIGLISDIQPPRKGLKYL